MSKTDHVDPPFREETVSIPKRLQGIDWVNDRRGGVVLATTTGLAASSLAEHSGTPTMPFALLNGMAFNFLSNGPRASTGIAFCSRSLLRWGVALLGRGCV